MTEQEYLDTSNLIRLRSIYSTLRDVLFMKEGQDNEYQDVCSKVHSWIMRLEKAVEEHCEEEKDD